jgi:hypothetical protein
MKKCLLAVILVLLPSAVLSHPGKTDRRGGHKCWKGCAEWNLEYKEYHLHDEYFRPVKPDAIKTGNAPAVMEDPASNFVTLYPDEKVMQIEEMGKDKGEEEIPAAGVTDQKDMTYKGDMWIVDPLILLSAALLLLLLLLLSRTTGKRNKEV